MMLRMRALAGVRVIVPHRIGVLRVPTGRPHTVVRRVREVTGLHILDITAVHMEAGIEVPAIQRMSAGE